MSSRVYSLPEERIHVTKLLYIYVCHWQAQIPCFYLNYQTITLQEQFRLALNQFRPHLAFLCSRHVNFPTFTMFYIHSSNALHNALRNAECTCLGDMVTQNYQCICTKTNTWTVRSKFNVDVMILQHILINAIPCCFLQYKFHVLKL